MAWYQSYALRRSSSNATVPADSGTGGRMECRSSALALTIFFAGLRNYSAESAQHSASPGTSGFSVAEHASMAVEVQVVAFVAVMTGVERAPTKT